MQVRLTKAKDDFYLMNAHDDTKTKATFKFLDAELIVRRIRPSPKFSVAHNEALSKGCIARYNLTRVELKTFTFAGGPQPISINNAVGYASETSDIHHGKEHGLSRLERSEPL